MKYAVGIVACILCLASALPAHAVKLEYNVKAGDSWKAVSSMKVSGTIAVMGMDLPIEVEVKSTTTQRVNVRNNDGSFVSTIDHRNDRVKVKVAGMEVPEQPMPPANPVSVTHSALGKALKIDGVVARPNAGGPDLGKAMSAVILHMPTKEINVGDTWEVPSTDSLVPTTMKGKLLEVTKENGKDVAKIEFTVSMSGQAINKVNKEILKDESEIGGTGFTSFSIFVIDLATGIPLRSTGTIEIDMILKINGMEVRQVLKGTTEETVTR